MIGNLPAISFVETDTGNIETNMITMYEAITGRTLAQGDPIRLYLLSVAAIIVQQRVLIDYSAKMNLLAYSEGNYLDHIGILVGVTRLTAAPAITTLRFTLSTVQPQAVTIPAGTRATTENGFVFATDAVAEGLRSIQHFHWVRSLGYAPFCLLSVSLTSGQKESPSSAIARPRASAIFSASHKYSDLFNFLFLNPDSVCIEIPVFSDTQFIRFPVFLKARSSAVVSFIFSPPLRDSLTCVYITSAFRLCQYKITRKAYLFFRNMRYA